MHHAWVYLYSTSRSFQWICWIYITTKRVIFLIKDIIQYSFHHTPIIFSKEYLCQHIRKVKGSSNVISEQFTHCKRLPHCMIENWVVFILQGWIRSLIIANNRNVITVNIGRPTPILWSLYLIPWSVSIPVLIATN